MVIELRKNIIFICFPNFSISLILVYIYIGYVRICYIESITFYYLFIIMCNKSKICKKKFQNNNKFSIELGITINY